MRHAALQWQWVVTLAFLGALGCKDNADGRTIKPDSGASGGQGGNPETGGSPGSGGGSGTAGSMGSGGLGGALTIPDAGPVEDGRPASPDGQVEANAAANPTEVGKDIASDLAGDAGSAVGKEVGGEVKRSTLSLLAGAPGGSGFADGTGRWARFRCPTGAVSDGAGTLFVADTYNHTIRKVVIATGVVTTLAGAPGSSGSADGVGAMARFNEPSGMATDGHGNLFVVDSANATIRKVVIATGEVTTLAGSPEETGKTDGTGAAARFGQPEGMASDGAGNLFVADFAFHTIRKVVIATGAVTTLAGKPGFRDSVDGIASAAQFDSPFGIASDGAGNLFVGDMYSNAIRKVVIATGAVTTLAGTLGARGSMDGTGASAQFISPGGLALDGAGNLFVADRDHQTIRKVVIATGEVTTFAGSPEVSGSADGTGSAARFDSPYAVASDGAGNLFVVDAHNNGIRKVVISTREVTTLAGAVPKPGSADGTGEAARFDGPVGMASDGAGNLFVADINNNAIRKVDIATGAVTTLVSTLDRPTGVTCDGAGHLFVTANNHTISKVVVATGAVTTLAGSPGGFGAVDGIGADARFRSPGGLVSDRAGNLFVADTYNRAIRKVVIATGAVTTLAGTLGAMGSADGTGADARFEQPEGLDSDGAGNLFVVDNGTPTIRQVVIATGAVTTLAGSGKAGHVDGTGTSACFNWPLGVAYDGAGSLFVADAGNQTIRKVVIATREVTTVIGTPAREEIVLGPLPASLTFPSHVAVGPAGELFIAESNENVVLSARF